MMRDYLMLLQTLLPQGMAWPRDADAVLTRVLSACAIPMAELDAAVVDLINEATPDQNGALLEDWLRLTAAATREDMLAVLSAQGGATPAYFIGLAAALGLPITITSPVGDSYPDFCVSSRCTDALLGRHAAHRWQVNVAAPAPQPALEALFKRLKPAHTRVFFIYQE